MNALRLAGMLSIAVSARALAQKGAAAAPDSAPRFVRVAADNQREPSVVDPAAVPVLNRHIAVRFQVVSRRAALDEIALAANVHFVYAGDVLPPGGGIVRFQSDNTTVADALTHVLAGASVDIAIDANNTLILVRKPRAPSPHADSVAKTSAADSVRSVERAVQLEAVRTIAIAESHHNFETSSTMSALELTPKELASAPVVFEGDILRTIKLLPGVETRNDYSSGLNVRGGESDQNLILLDGYPIYNPFHLGGLLGTFIDPLVGSVSLLTGAEPPRYGERLSSVLDVQSAEEARRGLHGAADVSLLATTASVGSAFNDGGSWMIGARHTYWDVLANAIRRNSLPYGFSDVQAHLSRPVFGGAILSLTGYAGSDGTAISQNTGGLNAWWGNRVIGATLSKLIPGRRAVLGIPIDSVSLLQRASITTFDASGAMATRAFNLRSIVRDTRASGSVTLFSGAVDQSFGYELSAEHVRYALQAPLTVITNFLPAAVFDQRLTPVSGWYDALWHVSERLLLEGGARADAVSAAGWSGLSPRLSAKFFLTRTAALIASTGLYAQWLHSLAEEDAPVQPLEFWIASNKSIPVSRAWQSSLGVEAWPAPLRQLRVEAFYKSYTHLLETNAAADPSEGESPIVDLHGTSYGADVLLRQVDNGHFGGWIAYSYAVSTRVTPTGESFSPGQDRRHELNAVGSWRIQRYHLSARFGIATGTPYTPIVGQFTRERYDPATNSYAPDFGDGDTQYLPGAVNSARLPFEHRLDVSITRSGAGERVKVSPYLSIANVYGASNTALYTYDYAHTTVLSVSTGPATVTHAVVAAPVIMSFPNFPFLPTVGVHIVY